MDLYRTLKKLAAKAPKVPFPETKELPKPLSFSKTQKFQHVLGILSSPGARNQYIRDQYEINFSEFPPADKHIELVSVRLEYDLLRQDYEFAKAKPSETVSQNIKAALAFDIEGFTPNVKTGLKIRLQTQEEVMEATTKKKIVARPSAGAFTSKTAASTTQETVTQSYTRLFAENKTAKLSDAQIALKLRQLHPGKKSYTVDDVSSVRSLYNRGKLSGQKTKPVIGAFVPNGSNEVLKK